MEVKGKLLSLDLVMEYRHDETVHRFCANYNMPFEEAEEIFGEMKKFLYLSAVNKGDRQVFIHEPLFVIDEMWHTFLLYTKDYQEFCEKYFGRFIHHVIVPRDEKEKNRREMEENKEKKSAELRPLLTDYYNIILETFGKETLVRWIRTYGKKYTKEYLTKIRNHL